MEDVSCSTLAVSAVTASRIHVARVWIENVPVNSNANGGRSYNFAIVCVHDKHYTRTSGSLASTADIKTPIRFVHRHGHRRIASGSGPSVLDSEFHRIVLDH